MLAGIPMDNSSCDKLEDQRDIFLRRGQMFLMASAERRNPLPEVSFLLKLENKTDYEERRYVLRFSKLCLDKRGHYRTKCASSGQAEHSPHRVACDNLSLYKVLWDFTRLIRKLELPEAKGKGVRKIIF